MGCCHSLGECAPSLVAQRVALKAERAQGDVFGATGLLRAESSCKCLGANRGHAALFEPQCCQRIIRAKRTRERLGAVVTALISTEVKVRQSTAVRGSAVGVTAITLVIAITTANA